MVGNSGSAVLKGFCLVFQGEVVGGQELLHCCPVGEVDGEEYCHVMASQIQYCPENTETHDFKCNGNIS